MRYGTRDIFENWYQFAIYVIAAKSVLLPTRLLFNLELCASPCNNDVCVVATRRRSAAAASVLLPEPCLQHDVHDARPAAAARHHVSSARRLVVQLMSCSSVGEHLHPSKPSFFISVILSNPEKYRFSNHITPRLKLFSKFHF